MNPLRETFHFLYANMLKKNDLQPVFGALITTTILTCLNLIVVTMLTDPFTGYFTWLAKHGVPTVVAVVLSMFAIGSAQYYCWIYNGNLEKERTRIAGGAPLRPALVYAYIATSILAIPVTGILIQNLRA